MKNLLLLLLVLPLLFSCGDILDKELTSEMLEDGYTGQGTYTFGKGKWEGDKYVGEWMNNMMHGQGTYTSADGTITKGLWKNDEFVG